MYRGCALIAAASCGGPACDSHPLLSEVQPAPAISIDPEDFDFSQSRDLLERIVGSHFGYFRFTNRDFADEVCGVFSSVLDEMPTVNLHGDAHLEQYAVTSVGRGLADFDDSSIGPAVIDLVRFGTSLELAARRRGWGDRSGEMIDRFFAGYRDSLDDPKHSATEPSIVARVRAGFTHDREQFLDRAMAVSEPISERDLARLRVGYRGYVEDMSAENPELSADYFTPVWFRRLRLGYGSALDPKFLARIRGPSDDPEDDQVLEIKQVRDLSQVSCLRRRSSKDVFRILVAQARLAEIPLRFVGELRLAKQPGNEAFWVHAWFDNYEEISIDPDVVPPSRAIESATEIAEVAYDVGLQLGRGHVREIASPLDLKLRRAQQQSFERHRAAMRAVIADFAARTIRGYVDFCEAVGAEPSL